MVWQPLSPLVGRQEVLGQFADVLASARLGDPAMVLVSGEAGIGKTRLVSEAVRDLKTDDILLHGGAVGLARGDVPFGILRSSLRGLIHRHGLEAVRRWAGPDASKMTVLAGDLAPASAMVSDPIVVIDAFRGLLSRLSGERFVWWAVEDLHWADSLGRDAVRYVVQLMQPPERLLVSCTLRTDDEVPTPEMSEFLSELIRSPRAQRISLEALTRDEVEVQLASLRGSDGSRPLVERVMALSDGVPFLVEELVAGGLTATGPLPRSTTELMLSRLASLDTRAQVVARAASVAPDRLQDQLLGDAAAMSPTDLEEALRVLVGRRVIDMAGPYGEYRFHHALMREAVSVAMLPAERARWHGRWAEALSALGGPERDLATQVEIAHHWAGAGVLDRAFGSAIEAARAAELMGAQGERAAMLCAALDLWHRLSADTRSGIDLDDLVEEAIWACSLGGRTDLGLEAVDHQLAAPDESADAELRTLRLTLARDKFLLDAGQQPRIGPAQVLEHQIAVLRRSRRCVLFARAVSDLVARSADPDTSNKLDALLADAVTAAAAAPSSLDHLELQDARSHHLRVLGRYPEAAELSLEVVRQAVGNLPLSQVMRMESNAVNRLVDVGRFQDAAALGRRTIARIADPRLAPHLWSVVALNLVWSLIETGDWDEAEFLLSRIRQLAPNGPVVLDATIEAARLSCRRGNLTAAEQLLSDARRTDQLAAAPELVAFGREVAAEVAISAGDFEAAWAQLSPALNPDMAHQSLARRGTLLLAARALSGAAQSRTRAELNPSGDRVRELREKAAALPSVGDRDWAWRARLEVELARCLGMDTHRLWAAAVAAGKSLGQPYEQAHALLGLARRALEDGRSDEARQALEEALAIVHGLGARRLLDAVREAAGRGRIRLSDEAGLPGVRAGSHGLTQRELDVLRLLAEGYRNERIGAELFISPKTASVHVSRILAKLGVSSRGEASAWAHREGIFVDPERG